MTNSSGDGLSDIAALLYDSSGTRLSGNYVTDKQGKFRFADLSAGAYKLLIIHIGYATYSKHIRLTPTDIPILQMERIVLRKTERALNEVVVVGKQRLIEKKIDRLIYNVADNPLASGQVMTDVFRLLPGVIIDGNDNISINGKSGVLIMMDNRVIRMGGNELKEWLRTLSASNVKNIEIISNPSAKFDAAGTGGIIKINSQKNTLQGISGNISGSYIQGIYDNYNTGAEVNYKKGKVNLLGGLGYTNWVYLSDFTEKRRFSNGPAPTYFDQASILRSLSNTYTAKTGLELELSRQDLLAVFADFTYKNFDKPFRGTTQVSTGKLDSLFVVQNDHQQRFDNINANLNYRHSFDTLSKQTIEFNYDLARFTNRLEADYLTSFLNNLYQEKRPPEILKAYNPTRTLIHTFKLDYSSTGMKWGNLELGSKLSLIRTDNAIRFDQLTGGAFVPVSNRTNDFIYKESIVAAYANWSREFSKGWSVQAGLRAEQTYTTGNSLQQGSVVDRSYLNLFPSVFLQKTFSEAHKLGGSYSRRIVRPDFGKLNPFEYYDDPFSYQRGNPYLRPELTASYELSYTYKDQYILTAGYKNSQDVMSEYTVQNDTTKVTVLTQENFRSQQNYSVSVYAPVEIFKWWTLTLNGAWFLNEFVNNSLYADIRKQRGTFTLNATSSFQLPAKYRLLIQGYYRSHYLTGVEEFSPMYRVNIGVGKIYFKGKLQARINVADIFRSQIDKVLISFGNQYTSAVQRYDSRRVTLTLTYKFNKGIKIKPRERVDNNEDEKSRVSP